MAALPPARNRGEKRLRVLMGRVAENCFGHAALKHLSTPQSFFDRRARKNRATY
jgi:hypothetical protein